MSTTLKARQVEHKFDSVPKSVGQRKKHLEVKPDDNKQVHWGKKGRTERKLERIGQQQQSTEDKAKKVAKDKDAVIGRQVANSLNDRM